MIKKLLGYLGYKVFTKQEYDNLTTQVAVCGRYYRSVAGDIYHSEGRSATVSLSEMSNICLVENCIWDDIKDKSYDVK